jgi:hypothetical protein
MTTMSIEMLTPERVAELWPVIEPYFEVAAKGNEIAAMEMDAKDIYVLAMTGLVAVFVYFDDGIPVGALGIQFVNVGNHKGAEVVALGGKSLTRFKAAYWRIILEWLKANQVEFVGAYAAERFAKILLAKFGFTKSCTYVRMSL